MVHRFIAINIGLDNPISPFFLFFRFNVKLSTQQKRNDLARVTYPHQQFAAGPYHCYPDRCIAEMLHVASIPWEKPDIIHLILLRLATISLCRRTAGPYSRGAGQGTTHRGLLRRHEGRLVPHLPHLVGRADRARRGSLLGGALLLDSYMLIIVNLTAMHPPNPRKGLNFALIASLAMIYLEAMSYHISWRIGLLAVQLFFRRSHLEPSRAWDGGHSSCSVGFRDPPLVPCQVNKGNFLLKRWKNVGNTL